MMVIALNRKLRHAKSMQAQNGFVVVGRFSETFTGTIPIEARPEGRTAYDMLRGNQADALIAYRMDRIARPPQDGDEWDIPALIRGLAKLGKEIHVCNRGLLKTDFASLLIAVLDGRNAGEEWRNIIERTSRGRTRKAREGKVVGCGSPPYGYDFVRQQVRRGSKLINEVFGLEIVESEARIVRMIFDWYTGRNGEKPLGAFVIANRLSEIRATTPGEKKGMQRDRPLGVWNLSAVYRILDNETYSGKWYYGKRVGRYGKAGSRPKDEQVCIEVAPIISQEQWATAQAQRRLNARWSTRNSKHEYLLHGMVKCGVCKRSMTGWCNPREMRFYYCNWRASRLIKFEGMVCDNSRSRADWLESIAWEFLLGVVTDREKLAQRLQQAQAQMMTAIQPKRDQLAAVNDLIKEVEAEADGIAASIRQARGLVAKSLQRQSDLIDERYANLIAKRDKVQAEINAAVITDESIADMIHFSQTTIDGLNHPTSTDKRRWLEYLRVQVDISYGRAIVSCKLPIGVEPRTFDSATSRSTG